MKAVILFPGQGAQKVGMGRDLYDTYPAAKAMMDAADAALGYSLTDVMFNGPDAELTRTCNCQPALYLHGLALWEILRSEVGLEPVAAAGLSLGEFTAHAAAGTFSMEDGLKIVQKRGAFMEEACQAAPSTMAAMIGGNDEAVQQLAADCDIDVANYNCPGQTVVSGSVEGVDKAVAGAKAAGFKLAKKLNVAGAYHSRYMKSAQEKLLPELAAAAMQMPACPVYCNYEARPVTSTDDVRAMLGAQVCGSVRWAASMQDLVAKGHTLFIEMGPGKTLAGMMGRICKDVTVISIEDVPSLQAAIETLKGMS
ncbi:MAG: ACP S-malonyltransferase [Akkermansia sp.]|nr:ACP S-malonyltransferase [Akkermansia sp.]MBQ7022024.1 ACP S-malonyltransferase [Akkermansia sp.]